MVSARTRMLGAVVACLSACCLPVATAAAEAGGSEGGRVPSSASDAAVGAIAGPAPVAVDPDGGPVSVAGGEAEVSIARDPDQGMVIDQDESSITVGLPGAGTPDGIETASGLAYEEVAPGTDIVARPTSDGAQALIVIDGPGAPASFSFPIEVDGVGAALVELPDGAIEIQDRATGAPVGTVTPPWATDASGVAVPTDFEVRGSTLVQTVDHRDAAYPVVADPNTCGWVTCTYYFGRRATKDIAELPILVGPVCAFTALVHPSVAAGCAVYAGAIVYQARRAKDRKGYCLKIKYPRIQPPYTPVLVPQIYSGRNCR